MRVHASRSRGRGRTFSHLRLWHTLIYSEEDIICVVVGLMSIALWHEYFVTSWDASMRHRQPVRVCSVDAMVADISVFIYSKEDRCSRADYEHCSSVLLLRSLDASMCHRPLCLCTTALMQ